MARAARGGRQGAHPLQVVEDHLRLAQVALWCADAWDLSHWAFLQVGVAQCLDQPRAGIRDVVRQHHLVIVLGEPNVLLEQAHLDAVVIVAELGPQRYIDKSWRLPL